MQIRPDDLPANLARNIAPLYLIHGDEPLAALEAGDAIRAAARKAGCDERDVLVVEPGFKWDAFVAANANMGLFGSRKLVDLRIPNGKPGVEGGKALEAYAADPNPDNVTLVTLPWLDRTAQASAWFAALADAGVTIAVRAPDRDELPRWIAARLARQNQKAARDVLEYLTEQCEGNLLAARQEIEKLALLLPEGEIALAAVEEATADVARYDVFQLSEAWLGGDAQRALRILAVLRAEGEPATLAVWQIAEDLHALSRVQAETRGGAPLAAALRNARVWGKRQSAMERAARRVGEGDLAAMTTAAARLDALSKGIGRGDAWDDLAALALALAGKPARPLVAARA
jgi:DNA polymerase-3 subunit delta